MPKTNHFALNDAIKSKLVFGRETPKSIMLSIVIPTYKRIDLLKKNIKAILSQENITNAVDYEVIIVANDSDFDYRKLGLELDESIFKIFVNEENLGMCGNMNRCALLAQGTYVAYIQDDDVLLTNFINEISQVIKSGRMKNIDWLIPNRYYLMPETKKRTQFGKKAIRNMLIKRAISSVLRMGRTTPMYQKITPFETLLTTYPYYAGGPTCGMLFKRESLIASGGFDTQYPYGFDYVFFLQFSKIYNVVLFNKYLSLYMTSDSASNRPEVQFDFFRARYYSLEQLADEYGIDEGEKRVIHYITYAGYPEETRRMIDKEFCIDSVSRTRSMIKRMNCKLFTYKSGGYRRMPCPKSIQSWYNLL